MAEIAPGLVPELEIDPGFLLHFEIFGKPISQGSKTREFNPVTGKAWIRDANPHNLHYWRADIAKTCREAMEHLGLTASREHPVLLGAVQLGVVFHFARPSSHVSKRTGGLLPSAPLHRTAKPDLGKCTRGVEDALKSAGLYSDDSHVIEHRPHKKVWSDHSGVQIWVWNLEPDKIDTTPRPGQALRIVKPRGRPRSR